VQLDRQIRLHARSAGVSYDVLHRRQPYSPPLGPQRTGTKEPSEESYGLASALCAPRPCSERGPFVENRSNGERQDDQCSWAGREDIALVRSILSCDVR